MEIGFMFGAGAESVYNICSGDDFAKIVLDLEDTEGNKKLNLEIKNHYSSLLKNCGESSKEWYPYKFKINKKFIE